MLSDQKLKQIHNLVKTSNVLTEQEKTEWMALIELMNDKQIAELEEILLGPKAVTKVASNPVAAPVHQPVPAQSPTPAQSPAPAEVAVQSQPPHPTPMPSKPLPHVKASSLSHISNLPSKVAVPKPAVVPNPVVVPNSAAVPPNESQRSPMPQAPKASASAAMPPVNPRSHLIMTPDAVSPVAAVSARPTPMPPVEPKPVPKPQPATSASYNYTPTQNIELKSPADVAAITSSVLHVQNRKTFHQAITDLAATQGYFQVLTSFEQSPLYKDYLNYGKSMLSGRTQNLPLSQEEFEFVSDILLSLKINRV